MVAHILVSALLFLTALVALIGVYFSHVLTTGVAFGTSSGSLAIIAFVLSVLALSKQVKACMSECACK
jgi:ABC-type bacteriocin/lantibiotic exporter with double-glycine peptidase domain